MGGRQVGREAGGIVGGSGNGGGLKAQPMHCGIDNWPTGQTFNITYNSQNFGKFKPLHNEKKLHTFVFKIESIIKDFKIIANMILRKKTGGKDGKHPPNKHPTPIYAFDPS